jgi:predicted amidohydrolase
MPPSDLAIASVQFEHRDGEKAYNLGRIRELTRAAVERGARAILFHECCIPAYSFVQPLSRAALLELAEPVPDGPSTRALIGIAREFGIHVLAGLFERDGDRIHNTCVCVNGDGLVARHRKLHTFVSPHLTSGSEVQTFEIEGWKCAILICYDNNLPENVRLASLQGAEIVFMPHVTGCLPSPMPGRGLVEPALWHNRHRDPVPLRLELDGPKGRGWLMRWIPARAWENGIYAVFSNPIGMDYGQVRNGGSMVLDPFGEVIAECRQLDDDLCVGICTREKLSLSSGRRYLRARRPELYAPLAAPSDSPPLTEPGWTLQRPADTAR